MGKVVALEVREGDIVKKGQLLLQNRREEPGRRRSRTRGQPVFCEIPAGNRPKDRSSTARVALKEAEDTLKRQEQMFKAGLLPREFSTNRVVNDVARQKTNLTVTEQNAQVAGAAIKQEEANLESASYDLNKLRVLAPISGIVHTSVTLRWVKRAVVGTMNNAGTVLLTIADSRSSKRRSNVDETDIPSSRSGSPQRSRSTPCPIRRSRPRHRGWEQPDSGRPPQHARHELQGGGDRGWAGVRTCRPGFTCTAVITTPRGSRC
jgi:HlyD family secretion protein